MIVYKLFIQNTIHSHSLTHSHYIYTHTLYRLRIKTILRRVRDKQRTLRIFALAMGDDDNINKGGQRGGGESIEQENEAPREICICRPKQ